jgi:hypothetical protein
MAKVKAYTRKQLHRARLKREKEEEDSRRARANLEKFVSRPTPKLDAAMKGCEGA